MPTWLGCFGKSGSPVLTVRISGPFTEGVDFEAIVDTGFTGFASIPLLQAFPLGLILDGTTSVVLADGSTTVNLVARAKVEVEGEARIGTVLLDAGSRDVLLGMDFLRHFKKALYVASDGIALVDEDDLKKSVGVPPAPEAAATEDPNTPPQIDPPSTGQ